MFERPRSGTRAVLVHIDFRVEKAQESLTEFNELVISAGVDPVDVIKGVRDKPDPKLFIGSGKAEQVQASVQLNKIDVVLFNHTLSPAQERNLERFLQCRVLDRTGLILDIFAQRAKSFEGKLQVELAQLRHLSTRLVRGWTHLERQKGGIGLRGPGETQLETDRRLIGARIKKLNKQLEKVRKQRDLRRKSRRKAEIMTISLVGYTNAGKSTLFNCLTGAGVYATDKLFATLDPTLRRLNLPAMDSVILADTVGFIRHLPHDLVAAFRATLEETVEANLLLHVIDAHDPSHDEYVTQVNQVLAEIGADSIPQLAVYNKIDLLDHIEPRIDCDASGSPIRVWISAKSCDGLDLLEQVLVETLQNVMGLRNEPRGSLQGDFGQGIPDYKRVKECRIHLRANATGLRARLYEWGVVLQEFVDEAGKWVLVVKLNPALWIYLNQQKGCYIEPVVNLDAINSA